MNNGRSFAIADAAMSASYARTAGLRPACRSDAATLNLAQVRQRGAQLGANEVHVHFLADTETQRRLVMCDLRAGQFGELSSEPTRASA